MGEGFLALSEEPHDVLAFLSLSLSGASDFMHFAKKPQSTGPLAGPCISRPLGEGFLAFPENPMWSRFCHRMIGVWLILLDYGWGG